MHRLHRKSQTFTPYTNHTNGSPTSKQLQNLDSWDQNIPFPKLTFSFALFLVAAVSIACYANSWDGDFVFDDSEAILNNKDVKLEKPWQNLFYNDFWGSKLASNTSHKSYRPLTVVSFRWERTVQRCNNAMWIDNMWPPNYLSIHALTNHPLPSHSFCPDLHHVFKRLFFNGNEGNRCVCCAIFRVM